MRKIEVLGLGTVVVEGLHPYKGNIRPREMSKISVTLTDIECSYDVLDVLDSHCLSLKEIDYVYGEASSMTDRAFEKAFAVMVDEEIATITISMPKRLIHENLPEDLSLTCIAHLRISEPGKAVYKLSAEEKLALAIKYKNMGVDLYKEGNALKHMSAYLFFSQAVKWLSMIGANNLENNSNEIKEVKMQCYNNLGLYHLQKKHYPLTVISTTKVLEVESTNIKARYRRSVANTELQNYEEAKEDIKQGLIIDPNNGPFKKQQEELKKRQKAVSEKYAVAMKKYFN